MSLEQSAVKPLAAWLTSEDRTGRDERAALRVMRYLAASADAAAGPALLVVYRSSGHQSEGAARALGAVRYHPAFEDLVAGLQQRLSSGRDVTPEVEGLGGMGEPGIEQVRQVFRSEARLRDRVAAAGVLAKQEQTAAFEEIRVMLGELIARGESDPRLLRKGWERRRELDEAVHPLAEALVALDPARAYAAFRTITVTPGDAKALEHLTWRIAKLERNHPVSFARNMDHPGGGVCHNHGPPGLPESWTRGRQRRGDLS